jgi:hypothetical protein
VLDPQSGAGLLHQGFDLCALGSRLRLVKFEGRKPVHCNFLRQVVKIARYENRPGLLQPQEQNLMTGRMAWSILDYNRPVSENVVIFFREYGRLAVL